MALLVLLLALWAGCRQGYTFSVGPTVVTVDDFAEGVWPDLPEGLDAMQQAGAPREAWDFELRVLPSWARLYKPNSACETFLTRRLTRARVTGDSVADSCLPHEAAHIWREVEEKGAGTLHDESFRQREDILREAARDTHLHR